MDRLQLYYRATELHYIEHRQQSQSSYFASGVPHHHLQGRGRVRGESYRWSVEMVGGAAADCTVGCTINNNNCCTLGTVAAMRNNNCSSAPRDTAQCTDSGQVQTKHCGHQAGSPAEMWSDHRVSLLAAKLGHFSQNI